MGWHRGRDRASTEATDEESRPLSPHTPAEVIESAVERVHRTFPRPAEEMDPALAWERHHPSSEEQNRLGRIRGFQRQGGTLAPSKGHRGSAASWVSVALAVAGFALGGLGIALGGALWPLVVGGVLMLAAVVVGVYCDILSDVVLDPPRTEPEEPHQTPLHRIKQAREAGET
ncbi:hypothetical protein [Nocardiopsis sp. MG754419]|uniref:hypothetical protein n=1 Tax=Nocardiopsis sp. MG754419 TaxID=2259865 RepID=UPI001BA736C6|nr:hypothetical protein [Nocardiopsis sp. MG754419]MBR8741308.1 hypothetical protein [Nocardiopsis sp. MG754419]